jgi:hypothetical protein
MWKLSAEIPPQLSACLAVPFPFTLDVRRSMFDVRCSLPTLAFSLQPLAFAIEPREAKPFTRMAKWEIRFQRFAISFRPSALRLHSISARQVDAVNPIEFDGIFYFA